MKLVAVIAFNCVLSVAACAALGPRESGDPSVAGAADFAARVEGWSGRVRDRMCRTNARRDHFDAEEFPDLERWSVSCGDFLPACCEARAALLCGERLMPEESVFRLVISPNEITSRGARNNRLVIMCHAPEPDPGPGEEEARAG